MAAILQPAWVFSRGLAQLCLPSLPLDVSLVRLSEPGGGPAGRPSESASTGRCSVGSTLTRRFEQLLRPKHSIVKQISAHSLPGIHVQYKGELDWSACHR